MCNVVVIDLYALLPSAVLLKIDGRLARCRGICSRHLHLESASVLKIGVGGAVRRCWHFIFKLTFSDFRVGVPRMQKLNSTNSPDLLMIPF